ncbi:hypothetical protein O7606_24090 [Micromonospora sp. WMMD882]|uniref:AraC-like ligand-binding domain-containing protein n=1 Tax=Micromonospora sp. WMMD882 TaxID=3015151 RepID=UPI00248AE04F|nr:hypothetical protein [Micromonospora sp. WMMD882]WBB79221.1 hypothetical protein O7606_24090 [Micromonospora sp. WMMD882]
MVDVIRFDTDDLPRSDRWPCWYEFGVSQHVPIDIRTVHQNDFRGTISLFRLDPVQVSTLAYSPLEVIRTAKLIRQSDPGMVHFVLRLRGEVRISQQGRQARLGDREMVLYDLSRPLGSWATARSGDLVRAVVQAPRTLVPLSPTVLDHLVAVPLSGQRGPGALLARHLVGLTREAETYSLNDAARLSAVTLDLLAATGAHAIERADTLSFETRQNALQVRIHQFIARRLGDPDLPRPASPRPTQSRPATCTDSSSNRV